MRQGHLTLRLALFLRNGTLSESPALGFELLLNIAAPK